jgi:hypothetical protein
MLQHHCWLLSRTISREIELLGHHAPIKRSAIALFLFVISTLLTPDSIGAQWRFEGWFGDAWNLPTPLTIEQDGEPDIEVDADWSTRPWRPTWYYSARISKWSGNSSWAFEYMHHKLYLDNPSEDVLRFRVTNGVNIVMAERHWRVNGFEVGVGAGPTWAVPISTVRGKDYARGGQGIFSSSYELAGATVMGTVARRVKLLPHVYASFNAKTTASRLNLKVADGEARLTNVALHLQWGISFQSEP